MLSLDVATLAQVTVFVTAILSLLLLFAWLQNRSTPALLWWGIAYSIGAVGIGLLTLRDLISPRLSIDVANALLLVAYGLIWTGARSFAGLRANLPPLLVAPAVWLAAMRLPLFAENVNARIVLFAVLTAPLVLLVAFEFWRSRREPLMSRWPAIIVLTSHAVGIMLRIPTAIASPLPPNANIFRTAPFTVIALWTLLYTITLAFILLAMTKERAELKHKTASLVDPLTGLANRRAFFEQADRHRARLMREGRPLALLVCDLDGFKRINDAFGHGVGDRILQLFSDTLTGALRPGDLIGRLGGEEFAVALPGTDLGDAVEVAERIRQAFAVTAVTVGNHWVAATVSIGVTASRDAEDLGELIAVADRALYRAKAFGRNRVEVLDLDAPSAAGMTAPPTVPDASGEDLLAHA